MGQNHVKEGTEIRSGLVGVQRGCPGSGIDVDNRELNLIFGGLLVEEKFISFIHYFSQARIGTVDLIDNEHDGQTGFQGLPEYEPSLWPRALNCVHQQNDSVDHVQGSFHLAAKVGVAGGVYDVDLDVVAMYRCVLGEDGDALLAFQVHGVHDPIGNCFVGSKGTGLPEESIDEGCLAVVHVGDDGNVSEVETAGHVKTL